MMNFPSFHAAAVSEFRPAPSVEEVEATKIRAAKSAPESAGAISSVRPLESRRPGKKALAQK